MKDRFRGVALVRLSNRGGRKVREVEGSDRKSLLDIPRGS